MIAVAVQACTREQARLPTVERDAFIARYDALLAVVLAANPPPPARPRRRGRIKQSPAHSLL
jgi:hypothetical protein